MSDSSVGRNHYESTDYTEPDLRITRDYFRGMAVVVSPHVPDDQAFLVRQTNSIHVSPRRYGQMKRQAELLHQF